VTTTTTAFGNKMPGVVLKTPDYTVTRLASCNHGQWIIIGPYKVWLQDAFARHPASLDVFIDLECSFNSLRRHIPATFDKYVSRPKPEIMQWEMRDGGIDNDLAQTVVNLLKAGFRVGWGCHMGHGRTGWLAAKVLIMLTGMKGDEALRYIRANYCIHAVETRKQLVDIGAESEIDQDEEYYNYLKWWEGRNGRYGA